MGNKYLLFNKTKKEKVGQNKCFLYVLGEKERKFREKVEKDLK